MRDHSELISKRFNDKLAKVSEKQDRPLRNGSHNNVITLAGVELPKFVLDVLSLGPKHPVRDKFNEVHFLADVNRLDRELRENITHGEKLCEIELSAKWYAKNVRETPMDRGVKKAKDFLKDQKLLAVPFDKDCSFCVLKQITYSDKLNEILSSSQFEPRNGESDDSTIRTEKLINSSLHQLMKQGEISEKIYHRLRATGLQPARLYGLADVHKIGTPLRPVLSTPGSSYENLNKFLSHFFEKLPGANIETNSKDARAALEATKLDEDELVVSPDVKSLYTNVPVEEAIEMTLKELYSSDEVPEIPRSAMKSLLRLAVTNVHFKCNKMWYTQSDGLAMGASLAVLLANLWMKSFEKSFRKPKEGRQIKTPDTKVICIHCNRRVTFRGKGVEWDSCKNWFHAKYQGITDTIYKTMQEIVWICSYCAEEGRKEDTLELKLLKRYVDDIKCTIKGNTLDYLEFTLETQNGSGDLAFLDLNINLNEDRKISCH